MRTHFSLKLTSIGLAVAAAVSLSSSAIAAGDPVISDIQIRGLNRVTKGAVLLALPVREGDVMSKENIALSMNKLYATGEFNDVKLSRDGNSLIVTVSERPTIGAIDFSGNSGVKTEDLMKNIEAEGIRVGEPLDNQALNTIEKSLEDFYHSSGMYQASVKAVITNLPRNRADIKIEIIEGKAAEIKQINIVGNKSFPEDVLLAQMELKDDVPWWNISANKKYSGQKFTADLESLKSFYMNRGYVNFKIDSTSVELTPDKKGIYLTISVDEGDLYRVSKATVSGNTLKYKEELESTLFVDEGEPYNQQLITANEKALSSILGKYGYANSEVKAYPIFDEKEKTVALDFNVTPGNRVNVSQVFITGNDNTDDTVIRRELRQMDGSWLSSEAIDVSKNRLNRTGYFETVDIDTENVGSQQDTVNVTTKVKERPTGSISGGIGFGTDSGFTIQGGISQTNLFGLGTQGTIQAYKNKYRRHMELGYTDPYFTVDNVSLGGRVFYDKYDGSDDNDVVDYSNKTLGAYAFLGYPISETLSVSYSLGVERNEIVNKGTAFQQSDVFYRIVGKNPYSGAKFLNYKAGVDFVRNTLDRTVFPTAGSKQILSLSATVPGSDLHYYKATFETAHYLPLTTYHEYVFGIRGKAGYGNGYKKKNGTRELLPFFDNFSLGGQEWLRGFSRNSVGPKALYWLSSLNSYFESDTSAGGNAFWAASAEFVIPTPFISESYKNSIRTSMFFDAGSLWDSRSGGYYVDYSSPSKYRTSAGISLVWMSPVGPLSFNIAKAIKKYDRDDTQVFNFNIGSTF